MIEMLDGFPDNVVACAATGQVTKQDYEQIFIPKVDQALKLHPRIRCYYELRPGFTGFDAGAAWADTKVGIEHFTRWERVAVITDLEWIRLSTNFFGAFLPGRVRVFSPEEAADAKSWIAAP